MKTIQIKRFLMGTFLLIFLALYVGRPLFFSRPRNITANITATQESYRKTSWYKRRHLLITQADEALKRGDFAAEERYLTKAAEEGDGLLWSYLARIQHKRGEYKAEFATMQRYMEQQEFCGRSNDGPLPCAPGAGWGLESKQIYDLLRYAEAADRVAPQESPRIWQRVCDCMNQNGSMGKTLPVVAGHTLTRDQIHVLAQAVNALWGGSIEEPKPAYPQQVAAVRAALNAVPECEPARLWLANDAFAQRYADGKGTPHVREAERQYKILIHSSDAAIRKDAETNLQEINRFRVEAAKWVPRDKELEYSYGSASFSTSNRQRNP